MKKILILCVLYTICTNAFSQTVGTVEASVLDYDNFIKITNDPKVIDPQKSTWIPADGRSIEGSKLSKLTNVGNAPDLRGTFLRGLNVIYSDGQPALDFKKSDPDGANRKPGDSQSDVIKQHNHGFSHVIQVAPNEPNNGGTGGFSHQSSGTEHYNNYGAVGVNPDGGSETRPRNVAVYYYIKIN